MNVAEAIHRAEVLLPGEPALEGSMDARWQAIIKVGEHIESEPEAVWQFVQTWGSHPQSDVRMAVATCLLEHLIGEHFAAFFPRVAQLALANRLFADTYLFCWAFGQAEQPANQRRFDNLKRELMRRRGS